jgi:integrase
MAFVWKHPKSKFFFAAFVDHSGVRRNRSTKSTNEREARRIAEAFEEAARKKRTAKQTRMVIAELHQRITGENLASQSWRAFSQSWIDRKTQEVSENTMAFYRNAISKFTESLGDRADLEMTELTTADVVSFRNAEAKILAPKTVNHDLKCVKMVFRAAMQDRVISEDPAEFVGITKNARGAGATPRRPFTIPQLRAVLSIADEEWRSLVIFGFYTGQRLGDIASLTWFNLDLPNSTIRLETRKTRKNLLIPISAALSKHIATIPAGDEPGAPVHPRAFATLNRQGKTANLSNQFADILAAAGLRPKQPHRKKGDGRNGSRESTGLSFHCLRHTAVSLLKSAGMSEASVMELVGHDSEQMSAHYTHTDQDELRKTANALPDIL